MKVKDKKGGRPSKLTPLQEIALIGEHKQGKDITRIAYDYGISYRTVSRIVKKHNQNIKE